MIAVKTIADTPNAKRALVGFVPSRRPRSSCRSGRDRRRQRRRALGRPRLRARADAGARPQRRPRLPRGGDRRDRAERRRRADRRREAEDVRRAEGAARRLPRAGWGEREGGAALRRTGFASSLCRAFDQALHALATLPPAKRRTAASRSSKLPEIRQFSSAATLASAARPYDRTSRAAQILQSKDR